MRLLAKDHGNVKHEARSDAQLAIASGIPINRIREISQLLSWDTVTFAEIIAFTAACSFDPTNTSDRRREEQYEIRCRQRNSKPFQYLRKHPKWHSEFAPLIKLLAHRFNGTASPDTPVYEQHG